MPSPVDDDATIIASIMGIARLCGRGASRGTSKAREDALDQLRYILYRINAVAPELFKRLEPLLIKRFSAGDWDKLQADIARKFPPPRPAIRKRRRLIRKA